MLSSVVPLNFNIIRKQKLEAVFGLLFAQSHFICILCIQFSYFALNFAVSVVLLVRNVPIECAIANCTCNSICLFLHLHWHIAIRTVLMISFCAVVRLCFSFLVKFIDRVIRDGRRRFFITRIFTVNYYASKMRILFIYEQLSDLFSMVISNSLRCTLLIAHTHTHTPSDWTHYPIKMR